MPAPAFRSAGTPASGTGDVTPALPTGWAENDIFLLIAETDPSETASAPAGYANVSGSPLQASGPGGTRLHVFWKRAASSESAPTITDPGNHCYAVMLAFSGCITTGNPWDVTATQTRNDGATPLFASVTTTVPDTLIVLAGADGSDVAGARFSGESSATLTDLAERFDNGTADGNGGGIWVLTGVKAAAGSTGTTTASTPTGGIKAQLTIALKPTAASHYDLTANNVAAAAPSLGTPALTQAHGLTADGLAVAAPEIGEAELTQLHSLTADALATAAPEVGVPVVTQHHDVGEAADLETAAPAIDTPTLTLVFQLGEADDLATAAPGIGTPTLTQTHALAVSGNLLSNPSAIDLSPWTGYGTPQANVTTAPDGSTTADRLIRQAGLTLSSTGRTQTISKAASAIKVEAAISAKEAEFDRVRLFLNGANSTTARALVDVDLTTGEVLQSFVGTSGFADPTFAVVDQGDGWWRVFLTVTTDAHTALTYRIYSLDSGTTLGDGTSGIYVADALLQSVWVSAPEIGTPTLSQQHVLTASALTPAGAVLGTPNLTQIHQLAAAALETAGADIGVPTLTQLHSLTADGLTTAGPEIGTPTLAQHHVLAGASDIVVAGPEIDSPALTQLHQLDAADIESAGPQIGSATLTQVHGLGASDIVVAAPEIGTPAITQRHALAAASLTTAAPQLGSPTLTIDRLVFGQHELVRGVGNRSAVNGTGNRRTILGVGNRGSVQ